MTTNEEINTSENVFNASIIDAESTKVKEDFLERELLITIAKDIENFAKENHFSTAKAILDISSNGKISKRTLDKFRDIAESKFDSVPFKPHVNTIKKIYGYLYQTNSYTELLDKAPENISNFLKKNNVPSGMTTSSSDNIRNTFDTSLTNSSLFNMIYLLTAGDHGTDLTTVQRIYGSNGIKILDILQEHNLIKFTDDNRIIRDKTITYDDQVRLNLTRTLVNDVFNLDNGEFGNSNYIAFINGEVTKEDFFKIQEMEKSMKKEILKIVQASNPTRESAVKIAITGLLVEVPTYKGDL